MQNKKAGERFMSQYHENDIGLLSVSDKQRQLSQPILIREALQLPGHLRGPLADPFQQVHVFLKLGTPELNTVLQVGSHESGAEGQNHVPRPAGHTSFEAAQDTIGFLGCEHTSPALTQFFIHQYLQVLLRRAALNPLIAQPVSMVGIALTQVQNLALGLVELHELYMLSMMLYGVGYPCGQLGSAVPVVSPPSFLCTPSLLAGGVGTNLSSKAPFQEAIDRLLNCIRKLPESENTVEIKGFVIYRHSKDTYKKNGRATEDHQNNQQVDQAAKIELAQVNLDWPEGKGFGISPEEEGEDSSHSSPDPAWGPSHRRQSSMNFSNVSPSRGLQFFTNCSSVGPFCRVQSCRNRLLQRGSPTGSQVLPANLLQHGLLSPWVHRSCQEPAPAQASHRVTASFGCIHLLWHGVLHGLQVDICSTINLHGLQVDSLPHHGLHHGLQGNLCSSTWSTSSPSFFTGLAQDTIGFLGCEHTLLAHVQLFIHQYPQVLLCRAALNPFIPQPVLIPGVALTQVQDPALGLVESHEVHAGPILQLVQVPLDGIPSLRCVNCTTQLGVICKLAEGALDLAVNSPGPSPDCRDFSNIMESGLATTSANSLRTLGCIIYCEIEQNKNWRTRRTRAKPPQLYQYPQVLFRRAALDHIIPQPVLIPGLALTQV
ncbi:hypothetical protein QYF61_018943 [Mycteria americana]|uniref:Uncharacterized protein n=1 Tax=Mycteria americana TaxID=33587 RepID=A0AAN7PK72_MYCAM|nr:hypothetical protein QYF61_018943 [Mycteria americana]